MTKISLHTISIFFAFNFLLAGSIRAQKDSTNYIHYYRIINEAKYYLYHMDYTESKKYYDQAFALGMTPANRDQYDYAKVLCEMGDTSRAITILQGLSKTDYLMKDSTYFTDISEVTKKRLVKEAEERKADFKQNQKQSRGEKKVNRFIARHEELLHYIHDSIHYNPKYDSIQRQHLHDSCMVFLHFNLNEMADSILKHGFAYYFPIGGLNYQFGYQINTFLFHIDPKWYEENLEFFRSEIAKGTLSPYDFKHGYFLFNKQLINEETDAPTYFKLLNEWGLSPYYDKGEFGTVKKGYIPGKSRYYDLYESEKFQYNCTDFNH